MYRKYLFCVQLLIYLSKWAQTLTLGSAVLKICSESRGKFNNKPFFKATIPKIFMSTNQTTMFETVNFELDCLRGIENVKSSSKLPLIIRPSGYVSILTTEFEGIFYNTNQYCILGVSESELQIQTCKRVCSEKEPCINKCCPPDTIYKPKSPDDPRWCVDPGKVNYAPRIYTSFGEIKGDVNPWYSWRPPQVWRSKCPSNGLHFNVYGKQVANTSDRFSYQRFRILAAGRKVLWEPYSRHWDLIEATENYCVDGIFYKPDQIHENKEDESFMLTCPLIDKPTDEKRHVKLYYGILFLCSSPFALITILIYALLWEKQNIHGWTIMSYCASVFIWFVLTGITHLLKHDYIKFEETTVCAFAATMAHYFVIATFCWLTLISFDLYDTFRSISVTKGKGVKKFLCYCAFGYGIPIVVVCAGWSMELMYKDDDESEVNIPRYGVKRCYISSYAFGLYIYIPCGILMVANILLLAMTTWKLVKIKRSIRFATQNINKERHSYSLFFKLFFVTGILWSFEIISWLIDATDAKWYWAILDSLNVISPFCIFVIFICKRDIIKSLDSKYPVLKCSCILSLFDQIISKNDSQLELSRPSQPQATTETSAIKGNGNVK